MGTRRCAGFDGYSRGARSGIEGGQWNANEQGIAALISGVFLELDPAHQIADPGFAGGGRAPGELRGEGDGRIGKGVDSDPERGLGPLEAREACRAGGVQEFDSTTGGGVIIQVEWDADGGFDAQCA